VFSFIIVTGVFTPDTGALYEPSLAVRLVSAESQEAAEAIALRDRGESIHLRVVSSEVLS
jgi:hypothetical protein